MWWLVACTACVGTLPDGKTKQRVNYAVSLMCFNFLSRSISAVITYHDVHNKPRRGICVANHTSPIDALVLMCDNCYSLVRLQKLPWLWRNYPSFRKIAPSFRENYPTYWKYYPIFGVIFPHVILSRFLGKLYDLGELPQFWDVSPKQCRILHYHGTFSTFWVNYPTFLGKLHHLHFHLPRIRGTYETTKSQQ